jgi:small GTP-binding protein
MGDPVAVSSVHGLGIGDLLDAVYAYLPPLEEENEEDKTIKVALIGRPNVGKSSLVNYILGEKRMIVSDIPGTTRDAVDTVKENQYGRYCFIDTAGIRRKNKVYDNIEQYSIVRSYMAIDRADVVLILIDASRGVTDQDVKIAGFAHERGKASIILVNKWDLVEKDTYTMDQMKVDIKEELKYMSYAPVLFISAKTGAGCDKLIEVIEKIANAGKRRVKLFIPPEDGAVTGVIYKDGDDVTVEYREDGIYVEVVADDMKLLGRRAESAPQGGYQQGATSQYGQGGYQQTSVPGYQQSAPSPNYQQPAYQQSAPVPPPVQQPVSQPAPPVMAADDPDDLPL